MNLPKLPEEIKYETHFRKGFHGDKENWELFVKSRLSGNSHEIACATNSSKHYKLVDACVFATYFEDQDIWLKNPLAVYKVGSDEHLEEIDFVRSLVAKRDQKIGQEDLGYLGLNEVSYFLRDYEVPVFDAVDYLGTEEELTNVYAGNKPTVEQKFLEGTKNIETVRDLAAYVRRDPAIGIWVQVAKELLSLDVPFRNEVFVRDFKEESQFNFSVIGGGIDIEYVYRMAGMRAARGSFRNKYLYMFPRPAQAAWDLGQELISSAYDRGSPFHPSSSAMHSIIYAVMYYLTVKLFDGSFVMPNGKTVEYNARVLKENGQHGRCAANVHYAKQDNIGVEPFAEELADKIINELLTQTQKVVCKTRY